MAGGVSSAAGTGNALADQASQNGSAESDGQCACRADRTAPRNGGSTALEPRRARSAQPGRRYVELRIDWPRLRAQPDPDGEQRRRVTLDLTQPGILAVARRERNNGVLNTRSSREIEASHAYRVRSFLSFTQTGSGHETLRYLPTRAFECATAVRRDGQPGPGKPRYATIHSPA